MTRSEALKQCAELNAGSADEGTGRWMAREAEPGMWKPVRIRLPGVPSRGKLITSQEATPPGADRPDARPIVNPNWGAG